MKKKKVTLNEEVSQMKTLMKKLLNEVADFHIKDMMIEEFERILTKLVLNKLNVNREDIFGNPQNDVYNKYGQRIKSDPIRYPEKAEEYEYIIDNFDMSELVNTCYQKIKDEYDDDSINYIPHEIENFAISKMKQYLDSLSNTEEEQ